MPHSDHIDRWDREREGLVCGPVGPVEHIAAMRGLLGAAETVDGDLAPPDDAALGRAIRRDNTRENAYWRRHYFPHLYGCPDCGAKGTHHPACPMSGPDDYPDQDGDER